VTATGRAAETERPSPLVGRGHELAILGPALTRARAGRGGAAIIEGEPGIGKTRLAMELRAGASDAGFLVGSATSYESDWSPPFGLWSQAIAEIGPEALAAQPGTRRRVLREAMPDLRGAGTADPPPSLPPEEGRFRALDAVARLVLDVAASEPLLVVLDDLQWADAASLEVLAYLARFLPGAPLLVLGTYRTGDVGLEHPLARSLGELDRHGVSVRVPLGPLSDGDALELVECLGGTLPPTQSPSTGRAPG
jgi:predicted ATPase